MTLQKRKSKSSRSSRKPRRKRGSTSKGRRPKTTPRTVALAEVKDDLSKYLRLAVDEEIVITRHGRAAGILIGFASEDDWFDYRSGASSGICSSHRGCAGGAAGRPWHAASRHPLAARGESLASHRDGRGAPPARRDDRTSGVPTVRVVHGGVQYREYLVRHEGAEDQWMKEPPE